MNELEGGLCQRAGLSSEERLLWEDTKHREKQPAREIRHRQARILCNRCPVLELCEERLVKLESEGIRVDGVVAGRYSTVKIGYFATTQTHCQCCGNYLQLAGKNEFGKKIKQRPGALEHAGEGLCVECYPTFRRRKKDEGQDR